MTKNTIILLITFSLGVSNFLAACGPGELEESASPELPQPDSSLAATPTATPIPAPVVATAPADGAPVSVMLDTGASVYFYDGALAAGSAVELRIVPTSEWLGGTSEELVIGEIYEVVAAEPNPGLTATITLPILDPSLTDAELKQLSIAYYDNGRWLSIPSTLAMENFTMSALVNHLTNFTIIRRLLGNSRPQVSVSVQPSVYSGVDLADAQYLNLDDLFVEIGAVDPEGDPVRVFVTLGFETIYGWAVGQMLDLRARLGNLMVLEAGAISYLAGNTVAVDVAAQIRDQIAFGLDAGMPITATYELVPSSQAEIFQISFSLRGLDVDLLSPVTHIHVFVNVMDDIEANPRTVEKRIAVLTEELPSAMELISPGPDSAIRCPAQPTFEWSWPGLPGPLEIYRLRLSKGENLWGGWFPEADWSCSLWECSGEGPGEWGTKYWTPAEPLADGEVYSWGILTASGQEQPSIEDPTSVPSDIFMFTVDASLSGSVCVGEEDYSDYDVFLTALVEALENADFESLGDLMSDPFYSSWNSLDDPSSRSSDPDSREVMLGLLEYSWGVVPGTFHVRNSLEGRQIAAELGASPANGFAFISSDYRTADMQVGERWMALIGIGQQGGRYYWTEFMGVRMPQADEISSEGASSRYWATYCYGSRMLDLGFVDCYRQITAAILSYSPDTGEGFIMEHEYFAGWYYDKEYYLGGSVLVEMVPTGSVSYEMNGETIEANTYTGQASGSKYPIPGHSAWQWASTITIAKEPSTGIVLEQRVTEMERFEGEDWIEWPYWHYMIDTNLPFAQE